MSTTEWAMWANEQGVIASVVLIMGGILGTAAQFTSWHYGVYSLALGILVLLIEYPRGKRDKGKRTLERSHQKPFTKFVKSFGVLGRNYWVRFVFYILTKQNKMCSINSRFASISELKILRIQDDAVAENIKGP